MSDEQIRESQAPAGEPDVLAELEAEVAQDLEEARPPSGGPAYQIVGALVALAVGIAGAALSWSYGLGTLSRPGAGLWPLVASLLIVALSLGLLAFGRRLDDSEAFTSASLLPVVGLITFIALGALLPVIGFEIPALVLCVIWLRFLGGETWRSTIVVSVVTVAAFYGLFLYALRIPLPHLF